MSAGQRNVLHHGHAGFAGRVHHLLRQCAFAHGQNQRQRCFILVVAQGDCQVRRVGHDDGRVTRALYGVVLQHFLVQLLALVLDVRVAFHLLVLLLDFGLGHHQSLAVVVALPDKIGSA